MTVMLYCTLPPSKEGVVNSSHNMVSPILAISCALRFAPLVTRKWWRGALGYDILCPHSLCPCSTLKDAIRWNLWRIDCVGRVQGLQSAPWVVGQLLWPGVHLTFWAFGLLFFFLNWIVSISLKWKKGLILTLRPLWVPYRELCRHVGVNWLQVRLRGSIPKEALCDQVVLQLYPRILLKLFTSSGVRGITWQDFAGLGHS